MTFKRGNTELTTFLTQKKKTVLLLAELKKKVERRCRTWMLL